MPLSSALVGRSTEPLTHHVDARWLMAYAASLDDLSPAYLDTRRPEGVIGHPLFPVCVEWPAVLAARRLPGAEELTPDELARGVHSVHDTRLHRLVAQDDDLHTTATVEAVERRSAGALQQLRLDTVDGDGNDLCTTRMTSLFLGVEVHGEDRSLPGCVVPPTEVDRPAAALLETTRPVPTNLAHIYTECSRIWNPIHTDSAAAEAAGLPGRILHGTATLALAVSEIVQAEAGGDPRRVRRIEARFAAMVRLPSRLTIRIENHTAPGGSEPGEPVSWPDSGDELVAFEVRNGQGQPAVHRGVVHLAP